MVQIDRAFQVLVEQGGFGGGHQQTVKKIHKAEN